MQSNYTTTAEAQPGYQEGKSTSSYKKKSRIVEETLRSTVNCIIVEVFLLKIVLHYVPFENQPDDPLKKLSIFFI